MSEPARTPTWYSTAWTGSPTARFLKLSQSSVYDLLDRGLLPSIKIGKSHRVPHRALLQFAASLLAARQAE
jgi:excisionase family DNA binding protein